MRKMLLLLFLIFSVKSMATCQKTAQVINATEMDTSVTSTTMSMRYQELASVYTTWTGQPFGTSTVQASLDGDNYFDLSVTAATGTPAQILYDIQNKAYKDLRVIYEFGSISASSTLESWISVKGGC